MYFYQHPTPSFTGTRRPVTKNDRRTAENEYGFSVSVKDIEKEKKKREDAANPRTLLHKHRHKPTRAEQMKRLKRVLPWILQDTARGPNDLVSGFRVLQQQCPSVPAKPSAGGTISPHFPIAKEREGQKGRNLIQHLHTHKRWRWAMPNDWFKPAVTGSVAVKHQSERAASG